MNLPFHIDLAGAKRARLAPNPARDWLLLLSIACILLIASALISSYFYRQAVVGAPLSASEQVPALSASLVGNVSSVFAARQAEEGKYESGAYSFVDPSK